MIAGDCSHEDQGQEELLHGSGLDRLQSKISSGPGKPARGQGNCNPPDNAFPRVEIRLKQVLGPRLGGVIEAYLEVTGPGAFVNVAVTSKGPVRRRDRSCAPGGMPFHPENAAPA